MCLRRDHCKLERYCIVPVRGDGVNVRDQKVDHKNIYVALF